MKNTASTKKKPSGQNQVAALGADGRKDTLLFMPEALTISTEKGSALEDFRPTKPTPKDIRLARDIDHRGIDENVIIQNGGKGEDGTPILLVVAGRRRVRAALLANQWRRERGEEILVRVPCTIKRGTSLDLAMTVVGENRQRVNSSPLADARGMQRLADLGATPEQIRTTMNCSNATMSNWRALLDAATDVQTAVDKRQIPLDVAVRLSRKLSHVAQKRALEEMLAAGNTKGRKGKEAADRAVKGGAATPSNVGRMRPRRVLETMVGAMAEAKSPEVSLVATVLRVVCGDDDAIDTIPSPEVRELFKSHLGTS